MAFVYSMGLETQKNGLPTLITVTPNVSTNRGVSVHYHGMAIICGSPLVLFHGLQF